jgi:uncharacterized membrane protein YeiB
MMLLGMALLKWGFLDGRRSAATYARAAVVCIPLGLALAGWGVVELERVRYAMPERTIPDIWNYVGAVFASVGYAAALLLRDIGSVLRNGCGDRSHTGSASQCAVTHDG